MSSSRNVEKLPPSSESDELESDFSSSASVLSGMSDSQLTTELPVLPFSDLTGDEPLAAGSSLISSFLIFYEKKHQLVKIRKFKQIMLLDLSAAYDNDIH